MSPTERRQELLEILCLRKYETYGNLALELNVSKMTIRRDVAILMCSYPVETIHGGRHGGVKIAEGFRLCRKILTPKQTKLLKKLSTYLEGDDLETINSILVQFSP